jgi:peptidylprolyl isomerase
MNVAKIGGTEFDSGDLVSWLKFSGRFPHVVQDMLKEKLAATAAKQQGISVSIDELQDAADMLRRAQGLHRAKDANQFLDDSGLSLDQLEDYLADSILSAKMRESLTDDEAVQGYFKLNAPKFDAIELAHIAVDSEGKANEIMLMLQDSADDFETLAREYSIVESATDGWRIGKILRGSLDPDFEVRLFHANAGDVLGPFGDEGQATYDIYKVEAKHDAELNADTAARIRHLIFSEWLEVMAREHRVEI